MKNYHKILIVTSEFPPLPGGIGNHAYHLAKNFQKSNNSVTVLADFRTDFKNKQIELDFDVKNNFKTIRIKRHRFLALTYLMRIIKYLMLSHKHDVIFASGKFPLWLVGILSFINSNPKIAIIHGTEVNFKDTINRKLTNYALKKFHKIIAVSNFTKSLLNHLALQHIVVIPNGFNIDFSSATFKNENLNGKPKLVTVGSISQRKGQHNVIKLLPGLIAKYPTLHYHIIGNDIHKQDVLTLIKKLHLEEYVTIHGMIDNFKMYNYLKQSDILIMLSENTESGDVEGFGIALLEANYFGIPTIGSKNCGIEDAIDNHKSGILINSESQDGLNNAVDEILNNDIKFRKEAKQWANKFTWDKIIELYINELYIK